MNTRRVLAVMMVWVVSTCVATAYTEQVRQALQAAVGDVVVSLKSSGLPADQTISVLPPIGGDEDKYVEGLLKNAVTQSGLPYVEGSLDPFWDEVMREIVWDKRKGDMLDSETLVKLGRLKGTQAWIYGVVREASATGSRVYVELELHLSSITTKQHLWGGIFSKRIDASGRIGGHVKLDKAVERVLDEALSGLAADVNASAKLKGVASVEILPLANDIDHCVRERVLAALSQTHLTPRNEGLQTVAEARTVLRDQPERRAAVLYGAIRDLSRELKEELPGKKTYEVRAEVQLTIVAVDMGDVLWSRTFEAREQYVEVASIWAIVWKWFQHKPQVLLYVLGGLAVLVILGLFARATRRVR